MGDGGGGGAGGGLFLWLLSNLGLLYMERKGEGRWMECGGYRIVLCIAEREAAYFAS
jgi:hypothetical protein